MKKNWSVYILKCTDKTLYTGITTDLVKRIEAHNAGKGARYTRGRSPVKLVWSKSKMTGTAARKLEPKIKKLKREQKEQLINESFSLKELK